MQCSCRKSTLRPVGVDGGGAVVTGAGAIVGGTVPGGVIAVGGGKVPGGVVTTVVMSWLGSPTHAQIPPFPFQLVCVLRCLCACMLQLPPECVRACISADRRRAAV